MVIRRGSRLINTTRPSRREAFPSRKEMNEEGSVEERRQRADTVGCDVSHLSKALESREFQPSKLVFVFFFFFLFSLISIVLDKRVIHLYFCIDAKIQKLHTALSHSAQFNSETREMFL